MSLHWDPVNDMSDLTGKIAVVTGGNTGIGFATVKYLALKQAKVYVAARSKAKAEKAIESLLEKEQKIDKSQLQWLPLDLSDLDNVSKAVAKLKSQEAKIDILINNAGVATSSVETLGDAWELHMAINHVGHFVFTNGVLPLLKAALKQRDADVRIVTLTSNAMYALLPPNFQFNFTSSSFLQNPMHYYPWKWRYLQQHLFHVDMIRYAVSKAANAMFAQDLQRRLSEQGLPILSISVHPGGVASEGVMSIGNGVFRTLVRNTFISTDKGAVTSLFAATASEVQNDPEKYGGKYLEPFGQIGRPHKVVEDQDQVNGMWENTTKQVNDHLRGKGLETLRAW
ncbi:Fc.00g106210.m01.CDS01 [Cosmosporella sp. VM-42]